MTVGCVVCSSLQDCKHENKFSIFRYFSLGFSLVGKLAVFFESIRFRMDELFDIDVPVYNLCHCARCSKYWSYRSICNVTSSRVRQLVLFFLISFLELHVSESRFRASPNSVFQTIAMKLLALLAICFLAHEVAAIQRKCLFVTCWCKICNSIWNTSASFCFVNFCSCTRMCQCYWTRVVEHHVPCRKSNHHFDRLCEVINVIFL